MLNGIYRSHGSETVVEYRCSARTFPARCLSVYCLNGMTKLTEEAFAQLDMNALKDLIDKLYSENILQKDEFIRLIDGRSEELSQYLFEKARIRQQEYYGKDVYVRGLIEFTNYCRNDCYYCGIRKSAPKADRYRLSNEEILGCCSEGYALGFRTFVLQGGEDPFYSKEDIAQLVHEIKTAHPDCALTLSIGEHSYETYRLWFDAGADRYLLRHETANEEHYGLLHPKSLSLKNRKQCLRNLKEIGYQVGCGFMVGSPYQSSAHLADDMLFMHELKPDMVGIGPFIPASGTPFENERAGSLDLTLFMLGLIRLMLPDVLLPATTALGTIHPLGREKGILAGANVCMPNLSPVCVRKKYSLYDNKICTGEEGAGCLHCLNGRMNSIGYRIANGRGDRAKYPVSLF